MKELRRMASMSNEIKQQYYKPPILDQKVVLRLT